MRDAGIAGSDFFEALPVAVVNVSSMLRFPLTCLYSRANDDVATLGTWYGTFNQ